MIDLLRYSYPPPSGRSTVSGLHWTIPKGTSAPGKVSPPSLVPMKGLTRASGSVTGFDDAPTEVPDDEPVDPDPTAGPAEAAADAHAR